MNEWNVCKIQGLSTLASESDAEDVSTIWLVCTVCTTRVMCQHIAL
jgi:hypothetical protein